MDKKAIVIVILAGLLLWQVGSHFLKPRAKPQIGRFVRLGDGPVWSDAGKFGYFGLNVAGSALAFDSATGQTCLTNVAPELVGLQPVLVPGSDGKPEPLADPKTGQPMMRKLPLCSEMTSY